MMSVRTFSRFFLICEALTLAIPSLFGLMFVVSGIFPMLTGMYTTFPQYLSCWLVLLTLCALWHLYFDTLAEKFAKGKPLGKLTQLLTFTGFALSLLVMGFNEFFRQSGLEIFAFGILYVPTYLHLLLEIKRQTGKVDILPLLTLKG